MKTPQPIEKIGKSTGGAPLPGNLEILCDADRLVVRLWLNNQKPLTRIAYASDIRGFFAHVQSTLSDLTLEHVQGYAASLDRAGYKPATQARKIAAMKSLCAMAVKLNMLHTNPAALAQRPVAKVNLQERIVSQSAVALLFDHEPDPRNKVLLRVLYAGGLRISELVNLTWSDLKARGNGGEICVFGKGEKVRTVTIGANLWREVRALRLRSGPEEPVFRSRQGSKLDTSQVHRLVKRAGKRVKLPPEFSAHWLRHAHASHALDNGANVHEVQKTLGHASLNTTTRYAHARRNSSDYLPD